MCLMIDRLILSRLESLYESSKSSKGGQGRDCVIYSVSLPLLSTNPTDSPDSRISVGALVALSECLCLWRKDPYLPSEPSSVRHLPRPNGLACSRFRMHFGKGCALPETQPPPSSPQNTDVRPMLGIVNVPHPTPRGRSWAYIFTAM